MDEQHPEMDSEACIYEPPRIEVISLNCEISAYAPADDDGPLF